MPFDCFFNSFKLTYRVVVIIFSTTDYTINTFDCFFNNFKSIHRVVVIIFLTDTQYFWLFFNRFKSTYRVVLIISSTIYSLKNCAGNLFPDDESWLHAQRSTFCDWRRQTLHEKINTFKLVVTEILVNWHISARCMMTMIVLTLSLPKFS